MENEKSQKDVDKAGTYMKFFLKIEILVFLFSLPFSGLKAETEIPSQWIVPSRKIVQAIKDDNTKHIRSIQGPKANFEDYFAEPGLKVVPMGQNQETLLIVTLETFSSQDGLTFLVYRLNGKEAELIQEFDTNTRDDYEVVQWKGESALLIHDNQGCLYFLRNEKLKKVFEYEDTDYRYQGGVSFQTKLVVEKNKLYLFRWNTPDHKPVFGDIKKNVPGEKAEVNWNEKTGRFDKGAFSPTKS